uniref:Uncharacterized protein n=1 Tax=Rhizophora mucronata TaxID=61149 RepID=A0A2P2NDD9_RHIMU
MADSVITPSSSSLYILGIACPPLAGWLAGCDCLVF